MLFSREIMQDNNMQDVLLKYQQKGILEKEIKPDMQSEMIADIISEKIITKIQKEFEVSVNDKK